VTPVSAELSCEANHKLAEKEKYNVVPQASAMVTEPATGDIQAGDFGAQFL